MFTKSISVVVRALALLMTTTFVRAAPISNAQIEEIYAALMKAKPARNFKNSKPATLKNSFNPSKNNTLSNAQIKEAYATLMKAKPARNFKNSKPAILKNSFNSSKKNTLSNAQIKEIYATLMKAKPAKNFKNSKPAILKDSFNSSKKNTRKTFSNRLRVTATAYTSHVDQTDSTPNIAAWGNRLYPGMKSIAVSRDLLNIYGLKYGQKVRIKGLEGEYAVLDKMNKRWTKKIDLYMGMDKRKAFQWGRRNVEILWN